MNKDLEFVCEVGTQKVAEYELWRGGRRKVPAFSASFSGLGMQAFWYMYLWRIPFISKLKTGSLANFCIYPCLKFARVFLIHTWSSTQQLKPLENVMFESTKPATQSTKAARSAEFGSIYDFLVNRRCLIFMRELPSCLHCVVFHLWHVHSISSVLSFETGSSYDTVWCRLASNSASLLPLSPECWAYRCEPPCMGLFLLFC